MANHSPKVITRFAPSPTGFLHIGGARTALYNWLFAKHHGGDFLLRIEDTDRKRSTDAAVDAIMIGMKWLELDWTGEAISQFERAERHREVAKSLLASGNAYECYATSEELSSLREESRAAGTPMRGDIWRNKDTSDAPEGVSPAIRIKMPREGETVINDIVQGNVTVQNEQLDDMVILRADGTPTYMLSVVVDDYDMGVTHVIRGDDHLNNAFRQIQIYKAMDWNIPEYAHIPLIHGADGKKLSKRHGALGVDAYEEMGFLPEAMRNYLLRLGWSHGDDEIIPTDKAIEWFTMDNVGKSPARFDFDKLDYVNSHYITNAANEDLLVWAQAELEAEIGHSLSEEEKEKTLKSLSSIKERAKRLSDIIESAAIYCDIRPLELTDKAKKAVAGDTYTMLQKLNDNLKSLTTWAGDDVKATIMTFAESEGLKLGKIMQPVRAAVSGGKPSGDLVEMLEILGQAETVARISDLTPN